LIVVFVALAIIIGYNYTLISI